MNSTDVTYVKLSGASSKATLGLYAGMEPYELDMLVRTALQHVEGACTGFQVTYETTTERASRKKRFLSMPRLVPLSVACHAPDVLDGHVVALFTPFSTRPSARQAPAVALETLLEARAHDDHLPTGEAAMLRHVRAQQKAHVRTVVRGRGAAAEQKHFLSHLVHPRRTCGACLTPETPRQEREMKQLRDAERVAAKMTALGMKMEHRQAQRHLVALADEVRQEWQTDATYDRFRDTMELLTLTEIMLDKHLMPEEHGAHLVELIVGEHKVLWSALQSYRNDGSSVSDLTTIAKRLAALGWEPPESILSKKSKGKSPRTGTKQGSFLAKKKGKHASDGTAALASVAVVTSLHAQHLLTSLELDIIKALIKQEDFQVLQALRVYKQSNYRVTRALRDELMSIVEEITMELGDEEKAAAAFSRGMNDPDREKDPLGDSDEDSGSLDWQRHLSFLLGQWQTQQELTLADTITLRKLVTQRHNLLESAYEVFAGDGDASELLDTLQRVAKLQRQIEQCQGRQFGLNGAPASGLSLEDVVREMQRRGVLQSGDAAGLLVLFYGENEALQAANEAFQADGDVHELEDTLLLVVKHARFGHEKEDDQPVDEVQAVCRLLADFGRSERLELWQIQLLISLLKSHDPRLLAAIDVYDEDQEMNELADTLEILVDLAAWERHCRAIAHDWIPLLARSGKLPRDRAERLVQMVKARDDRVVAALVVFLSDNNKEEFVDTLVRIAFLEAMKPTDAEADKLKERHLVLSLLNELEDKGTISIEDREQVERLVYSLEPGMLAAMVLAATHDEEKFADIARWILVNVKDQVKDGMEEKLEFKKVKPLSEAVLCSIDAELTANKQESEENSDNDVKDNEPNAQALKENHGDTIAEAEVDEERGPNVLAEQQEIEQTDEPDRKE